MERIDQILAFFFFFIKIAFARIAARIGCERKTEVKDDHILA